MPKTPVEQIQDLKKRREQLIAQKAALEERSRQNQQNLGNLRKELTTLGVSEDSLQSEIEAKEKKLEADVKAFEGSLAEEETKVQAINQRLTL